MQPAISTGLNPFGSSSAAFIALVYQRGHENLSVNGKLMGLSRPLCERQVYLWEGICARGSNDEILQDEVESKLSDLDDDHQGHIRHV
jgi:hypothetical protein